MADIIGQQQAFAKYERKKAPSEVRVAAGGIQKKKGGRPPPYSAQTLAATAPEGWPGADRTAAVASMSHIIEQQQAIAQYEKREGPSKPQAAASGWMVSLHSSPNLIC